MKFFFFDNSSLSSMNAKQFRIYINLFIYSVFKSSTKCRLKNQERDQQIFKTEKYLKNKNRDVQVESDVEIALYQKLSWIHKWVLA